MGNPLLVGATMPVEGVVGGTPQPISAPSALPMAVSHGTEQTFLASGARTTTQTMADQANADKQGIDVIIDVTSAGTGSIACFIEGKDQLSGKYFTVLASANITTNVTTRLRVYPGLTAAANSRENDILPGTWRLRLVHNNANTITYSVSYRLVG